MEEIEHSHNTKMVCSFHSRYGRTTYRITLRRHLYLLRSAGSLHRHDLDPRNRGDHHHRPEELSQGFPLTKQKQNRLSPEQPGGTDHVARHLIFDSVTIQGFAGSVNHPNSSTVNGVCE
jgi:hypothetical protein